MLAHPVFAGLIRVFKINDTSAKTTTFSHQAKMLDSTQKPHQKNAPPLANRKTTTKEDPHSLKKSDYKISPTPDFAKKLGALIGPTPPRISSESGNVRRRLASHKVTDPQRRRTIGWE